MKKLIKEIFPVTSFTGFIISIFVLIWFPNDLTFKILLTFLFLSLMGLVIVEQEKKKE